MFEPQQDRLHQGHRECQRRRFVMKGLVHRRRAGARAPVMLRVRRWRPSDTGAGKMPDGTVNDPHVFVAIDPSGLVTILTHRSEMGTGVRTSLPMVVADEMEADWSRVRVARRQATRSKFGNQDTDGSRSMRHYVHADAPDRRGDAHDAGSRPPRSAGASPVAEVRAENHEVVHPASAAHAGLRRAGQGGDAAARPSRRWTA